MSVRRSKPIGRDEATGITTDGEAFPIPNGTAVTQQFKVFVTDPAYIGVGVSGTPPAASETNSVHQEADTEVVYTLDGTPALEQFVYIYSKATTIDGRISFFG